MTKSLDIYPGEARGRLLKKFSVMKLSYNTAKKIADPIAGMTDPEKEERAALILSVMDTAGGEEELIQKLQEMELL